MKTLNISRFAGPLSRAPDLPINPHFRRAGNGAGRPVVAEAIYVMVMVMVMVMVGRGVLGSYSCNS